MMHQTARDNPLEEGGQVAALRWAQHGGHSLVVVRLVMVTPKRNVDVHGVELLNSDGTFDTFAAVVTAT